MIRTDELNPVASRLAVEREEDDRLKAMSSRASSYIESFSWGSGEKQLFLGLGVGSVVAVFLCEFLKPLKTGDQQIWVVVGDLPSCYFVVDRSPTPVEALNVYCELMEDWCESVNIGKNEEYVFPVNISRTSRHAEMLQSRVDFIRQRIIPKFKS